MNFHIKIFYNLQTVFCNRRLLSELERHECSGPFLKPVDLRRYPSYRVIQRPMDLSAIRQRLKRRMYFPISTFNEIAMPNGCSVYSPVYQLFHANNQKI